MDAVGMYTIYEFIERAIKVNHAFTRDRHYVIREGEVVIVDEFTGRLAEGRKWRDGITQAIEAREDIEVTVSTGQAARVTVQDYFKRYEMIGGMTGTARSSAKELKKIYGLRFVQIPTNRPEIRQRMSDVVHGNADAKWSAIVEEVRAMHSSGRPVLIGTRSIDKSEELSRRLVEATIPHQVLNAHRVSEEAEIISRAGQLNKVTVSTNMAGRGTDIQLGDEVAELGGLHVICTEMHDASRIDRQLVGRCGRQGDPGTFRQFLALDDDILLAGLGRKKAEKLIAAGEDDPEVFRRHAHLFRRAQRRIERRHFRDRKMLMYYEEERQKMQLQMGQDPYLDTPS
jgi:preprotein translocase subunit SecA